MTRKGILIQVLTEESGKPEKEIKALLSGFSVHYPEIAVGLAGEVTEAEAESLAANLRREAAGILAWLIRDRKRMREKIVRAWAAPKTQSIVGETG